MVDRLTNSSLIYRLYTRIENDKRRRCIKDNWGIIAYWYHVKEYVITSTKGDPTNTMEFRSPDVILLALLVNGEVLLESNIREDECK